MIEERFAGGMPDFPEFRVQGSSKHAHSLPFILPDGREVLRYGATDEGQFDLPIDFTNDSQLSVTGRLVQLVVEWFRPVSERGEAGKLATAWKVLGNQPFLWGLEGVKRLLKRLGVDARLDVGFSLEDLAQEIENGALVLASVNAGELWKEGTAFEHGDANYMVILIAVYREPVLNQVVGFDVLDVCHLEGRVVVDQETMKRAWLSAGGLYVAVENGED